jgi:sulfur carrier protein
MKITINGESKEVNDGITVTELLQEISTPVVGVAVELNRAIVPRSLHVSTVLQEGDLLEIVKMVGGG